MRPLECSLIRNEIRIAFPWRFIGAIFNSPGAPGQRCGPWGGLRGPGGGPARNSGTEGQVPVPVHGHARHALGPQLRGEPFAEPQSTMGYQPASVATQKGQLCLVSDTQITLNRTDSLPRVWGEGTSALSNEVDGHLIRALSDNNSSTSPKLNSFSSKKKKKNKSNPLKIMF